MSNCTNCNGEGIVGGGDKPWLKQGALHTCKVCNGTGKIDEESPAPAPVPTPEPPAQETQDTSVDNAGEHEKPKGLLERILG